MPIALAATAAALLAGAGPVGDVAPAAAQQSRPPVVLVVFDGLATRLLQTAGGEIDAVRYPSFARFAEEGTWFPNGHTIHESTRFSVPSIFDGKFPQPGQQATALHHPRSLFTLLEDDYTMNVWEEASRVCPVSLCKPRSGNVIQHLAYGRTARFRAAVRQIRRGAVPQLSVIHTLLPHEPRQYIPDGRTYQRGRSPELAVDGTGSYHRRFLVEQAMQRTLLQMRFTDRLLGELVARLKRERIWDDALVALVGDHGESFAVKPSPAGGFRVGELTWRRAVRPQNIHDIAPVGYFVKFPGQRSGRRDTRWVRTIDLVPTILQAAGVPQPGDVDGRSLQDEAYHGQAVVRVGRQAGGAVTLARERLAGRAAESRRRLVALFGQAGDSLFDFGPRKDLNGRPVAELRKVRRSKLRARPLHPEWFRSVRGSFVPAHLLGRLRGPRPGGRVLAFALNGTVVATAPSYAPMGKTRSSFSVLLPPDAFRRGRNRLEIFEVVRGALRPLQ